MTLNWALERLDLQSEGGAIKIQWQVINDVSLVLAFDEIIELITAATE